MSTPAGRARSTRTLAALMWLAALALLRASALGGQGTGLMSGMVIDGLSGMPIEGASVSLRALDMRVETGRDGRFVVQGFAPDTLEVRFVAPGYVTVVEQMDLSSSTFVQIRLDPLASVLDELLVLAGRAPRDPASTPVAAASVQGMNVLDLLAELPGIAVQRGGGINSGGWLIIRGVSSFQSDLAPGIYLDGVQLDNRQMARDSYHTLEKIPAESVARIRVLTGPDAFMYPMAANGVILIETRRGGGAN